MEIEKLYSRYTESYKVSTDTRQVTEGSVFFALKGQRFDANAFAEEAIDKGARYAVIDDARYQKDDRFILVGNVLETLQELAKYHRAQLSIPVLALTGSNGKTTTKELISAVLSQKFKTWATRGNLNNHIGVPLTLLAIDPSFEMAVVEMGANHVGEISLLCDIANPTHGLITNIGKAHVGPFGGFENVVKTKSELYDHLGKNQGKVFYNSADPLLSELSGRFPDRIAYPGKDDYYRAELLGADPMVRFRADNGEEVHTQLIGTYNFYNIAAALCIGKFFGADAAAANRAVAEYVPSNMRSQVINTRTNNVILDAYNANPSSMAAAIDNLASMKAGNKVLILGDMFELGDVAEAEHRAIGALIHNFGFDEVYFCGEHFAAALEELPNAKHFATKVALIESLQREPLTNSTILVKGSRGMGLEDVVPYL